MKNMRRNSSAAGRCKASRFAGAWHLPSRVRFLKRAMPDDTDIPTQWSEQQVRDYLKEFPTACQNVKLPYGLETGGADLSKTLARILPAEMSGKTVLDVGSANGLFCFEALKRGAIRAKGIGIDADVIRQSRLLADCLQLKAEFAQQDIDALDVTDQFDYVLCLNILHHMKNPISVIEKLIAITREKLIIEVASPGRRDWKNFGIGLIGAFCLRKAAVIFVDNNGRGRTGEKYFISPKSLENILLNHHRVFASVTIEKSRQKGRFIVTAEKRRIRRMLVIAGPTSVGKSTFIEKLRDGEFPELEKELGFHDLKNWESQTGGSLMNLKQAKVDSMIFHYDFLRVHFRSERTPDRDPVMDVLGVADEITFITLTAPREVLLKRLHSSEIEPKMVDGKFKGNKRHVAIRDIYSRPGGIDRQYRSWFDFVKTKSSRQYVVDTSVDPKLVPLATWEAKHLDAPHP